MSCDARGSKESTAAGPFVDPFGEIEQHDMYDLVEWMAAQPWSNGDVGVGGYSYGAILAYLGAAQRPPHLRAVAARASYANLYKEMVYLGGIRGLDVAAVAGRARHEHDDRRDLAPAPALRLLLGGARDRHQVRRAAREPGADPRLRRLVRHLSGRRDENYMALRDQTWLVMNWGAHLDDSPVPNNALLAWYDHWLAKLPSAPLPDDKVIS